ncbi:MAG: hypothetical protein CM1200mP2_04850 [Planctomycetaceae bacterium]|nr:MAG: hypothetical protein CM1200mP2_04850 [Planctomycetaceae bacterium]
MPSTSSRRLRHWPLVVLLACAGCGETRPVPEDDSADKIVRPPTAVSLQLNWFPEAEHGGVLFCRCPRALRRPRGLGCGNSTRRPRGPGHHPGRHGAGPVRCDQRRPRAGRPRRRSQNGGSDGSDAGQPTVRDGPRKLGNRLAREAGTGQFAGREQYRHLVAFLQKKVDLSGVQLVPYAGNVTQFLLDDDFAQQGYSISEPFVARQKSFSPPRPDGLRPRFQSLHQRFDHKSRR